jgi:uncharacterized protein with PIN domain
MSRRGVSDVNNYRGGILWRCTFCGRYYSLWKEPTLWRHLERIHGITRESMERRSGGRLHELALR